MRSGPKTHPAVFERPKMRKWSICFLLAGCCAQPVARPITVEVPVPVPCRAPVVVHPVWPTLSLTDQSSMLDQVKAFLAENELRQGYETQLEASLQSCRE